MIIIDGIVWEETNNGFLYCFNEKNELCLYNPNIDCTWFLTKDEVKKIMLDWSEKDGGKY